MGNKLKAGEEKHATLQRWLPVRRSEIFHRRGNGPSVPLQLCRLSEAYRDGVRGSGLVVPSEAVSITGKLSTFTMPGGQSGEPMHRRFFDDNSAVKPTLSLFCEQAPSWVVCLRTPRTCLATTPETRIAICSEALSRSARSSATGRGNSPRRVPFPSTIQADQALMCRWKNAAAGSNEPGPCFFALSIYSRSISPPALR